MTYQRCALRVAAIAVVTAAAVGVLTANQAAKPAAPRPATIAEVWRDPGNVAAKDLRWGPGGQALSPGGAIEYTFKGSDTTGFSPGYDVVDPQGRKWDVKTGDEGQPEVLTSRILWAIGYHQPTVYFVPEWTLKDGPVKKPLSGRFRLASDHDTDGEWSWTDNPFVGTRELKGLVVANLIVNNWDLKPSQNRIFSGVKGPSRWFVVQDVGASFGKTAWPTGTRNNVEHFESQKLILGVKDGRVQFDYHARHRELLQPVTPADVVWVCRLLERITDRQWSDLFRGAHMSDDAGVRYTAKLKSKINEGLALAPKGSAR